MVLKIVLAKPAVYTLPVHYLLASPSPSPVSSGVTEPLAAEVEI